MLQHEFMSQWWSWDLDGSQSERACLYLQYGSVNRLNDACVVSISVMNFFFEERYYLYSFPKHVFWKYKYLEITWINCNVNYVETERLYDLTSWPVLKPHTSVLQFVLRYETPTLVVISEYSDRCEETLVVGMACVVTRSNIWHG